MINEDEELLKMLTETIEDVLIVELEGERLDGGNVDEFKKNIKPFIEGTSKMVIDLKQIRFVDSSGLGSILSCLRQMNAKSGDLKICGISKSVRVLFELIRLHRIIDILNTREEAIKAFR